MFSKALVILSLISVAFATVYVTTPVASTIDSGGQTARVAWQDDGNSPSLAMFGPAEVSVYTGNANQQTSLQVISANLDVSTSSSINFTVDSTIGPDSSHYFIRFQSNSGKSANGTAYLAFSSQFSLTNMTGTFNSSVSAEIAGLSTAPLAAASPSSTLSVSSLTPSLTTSIGISTRSPFATVTATSGAMGIKAGWAGLVFGAVIGVTMF